MDSDHIEDEKWRVARASDLGAIEIIGNKVHVDLQERPEVFAEKFHLFPEGCFVLIQGQEQVGYGISHPWLLRNIPPLDTLLNTLPRSPECLFIHDVVVREQARGQGAAGAVTELIATVAQKHGIGYLALVSVYDTHPLWGRFGFEVVADIKLNAKLKSYGDTARYMVRKLR